MNPLCGINLAVELTLHLFYIMALSIDDLNLFNSGGADSMKSLQNKLKPKKSNIPIEMLDTANTYDDKVSLIRLLVADDAKRVANVLKSMIGVA